MIQDGMEAVSQVGVRSALGERGSEEGHVIGLRIRVDECHKLLDEAPSHSRLGAIHDRINYEETSLRGCSRVVRYSVLTFERSCIPFVCLGIPGQAWHVKIGVAGNVN